MQTIINLCKMDVKSCKITVVYCEISVEVPRNITSNLFVYPVQGPRNAYLI